MPKTFIDFMSDRLSDAKMDHEKWPDRIFLEVRTDVGVAAVSIRTKGDFTVCVVGLPLSVSSDQIGVVSELINRINLEFAPGSLAADFDDGMITCRTAVPFGLVRNDDLIASLLLGSTFGGVAGAVRAVRDVIAGTRVKDAVRRWRNQPIPASFTLPGKSLDRMNPTKPGEDQLGS